MPLKTHCSALAVVPPEKVWGSIQAIRRRHDRQVKRWMPHVNLLYPFRPRTEFSTVVEQLVVSAEVEPFQVSFREFRFFRHGSGRCTLWSSPEPVENWRGLQAALQAAFPDCDDLRRFPAGFTPHLSVGQFPSPGDCERTRQQLQAGWQAVNFALSEVALPAREGGGAFRIAERVTLGESGAFAPSLGG
jgi:2'-5' RNA ligase